MTDDLLSYYDKELRFLRSTTAEFADRNERVASRLLLKEGESQDPHVERLLQGVAYLNARTRKKLDDDFPELARSLLSILYPHYVRPFPSVSILQFGLSTSDREMFGGYRLESRKTLVETEPEESTGVRCRFQTCYPVHLWPVRIADARFSSRPFAVPSTRRSAEAQSCVRLRLETFSKSVSLADFEIDRLRMYLHPGRGNTNVFRLYELLLTRVLEIVIVPAGADVADIRPVVLRPDCVKPVGLKREETILPADARSFPGYALLTEFFTFPQKFLFIDLCDLGGRLQGMPDAVEILFLLDVVDDDLSRTVETETFQLGCTPGVNLFSSEKVLFQLTEEESEYLIDPAPRNREGVEIYSVDQVEAISPEGEPVEYHPFYSFRHAGAADGMDKFWHTTSRSRSSAGRLSTGASSGDESGRDVWISFVDLDLQSAVDNDWTVRVEATCHNRDCPENLPFGQGRPRLDMPEGRGSIATMECLCRPTQLYHPPQDYGAVWRLVSLLSLNHLSITGSADGAAALREILSLHDLPGNGRSMIRDGIRTVESETVTRPLGLSAGGFGRGSQIRLEIDESAFTGSGAYLFCNVLNEFFGLYTTINSFIELEAASRQRRGVEEPWKWPLRSGDKTLI